MFMATEFKRLLYASHEIADVQHGEKEWKQSEGVTFELLYISAQKCIYALKCPKARASETSRHKELYVRQRVMNGDIFTKPVNYGDRIHSIIQSLQHNDQVVAAQPILEVIDELKNEVSPPSTTIELERLRHKLAIEKIAVTITKSMQKMTAELQLNTWFFDGVRSMLQKEFGLIVYAHREDHYIPESGICVYGGSQPDISFYPPVCDPRMAFGGAVMPLREGYIIESMAEFKTITLIGYNQACANMIRIAAHIAEEHLKAGRDIDYVSIMGILVSHTRAQCIPLQLCRLYK